MSVVDSENLTDGEVQEELRRLGKFEIHRKLGAGGMGTVFLATDTELRRAVALKVLPKDRSDNPRLVRRFKAEAQAVASLRHDNIVAIYEAGEIDGYPYLALEYVAGVDVHTLIQKRGVLPARRSLKVMLQIASALQHAFEKGIVHRDIKPSNLLITTEGVCKLTDLGLARSIDDSLDTSITRAGTTVGTIDYIAPEQACDSKAADIRSDIYSLGCTWYHMLTGEPPFGEGDLQDKIRAHLHAPPPNPRQLNPNIPEAYVAVMTQMMAKRPQDRYQSPADLLQDLNQVAGVARSLSAELFDEPQPSDAHDEEEEPWEVKTPPEGSGRSRSISGDESPGADEKRSRKGSASGDQRGRGPRRTGAAAEPEATEDVAAPSRQKKKSRGGAAGPERNLAGRVPKRSAAADLEAGDVVEESVESRPRKRLPARDQKDPTGFSVDLDFARIVLIGSIVLGILGLFWWALSRGSSWSTPVTVGRVENRPVEAPASDAALEPAAAPPRDAGPPRAEAEFLAGDPAEVQRLGIVFAGTDDLGSPDSKSVQKFVPDWVYAVLQAKADGIPATTVSLTPGGSGVTNLNAALKRSIARVRVVELVGDGPFPLDPESLQDVDRMIIRAAPGARPLVIFRGTPAATARGHLQLAGGVLELQGLHLLTTTPPDAAAVNLLAVEGGTIVLRDCSATQGEESGPATVCSVARSDKYPFPPRVLIEGSLIRGANLTAASGVGERPDLVIGGSLLAGGKQPVLKADIQASGDPAVAAPDVGESGTRNEAEAQGAVRLLGTVLMAERVAISLHQASGPRIVPCVVQIRRSILTGGAEATLLSLPEWPVRKTSVSGQPRAARLRWQQEHAQLMGWPRLVQLGEPGTGEEVADAEAWERFWSAGMEPEAISSADVPPVENVRRVDQKVSQALARTVPADFGGGAVVGIEKDLPAAPDAAIDQYLLLSGRPQLPSGFVTLPPPAGEIIRLELRSLRQSLNDYLNGPEVPNGAHVQLSGIGLVGIPPIHLRGKSLRLEFLQAGDGAPLVIRPEAGKGETPPASILVENARLDLLGAWLQATPSRTRNVPPRLISVRNGELTLRNCRIEGTFRSDVGSEPLVEWVDPPTEGKRQFAYMTDSLLLGTQPLFSAEVDRRLLVVNNCILASHNECLGLESQVGAKKVDRSGAGWVVLEHCTFLVGTQGVRLAGSVAGRELPAVHVECTESVFAPAPGTDPKSSAILRHPERMTSENLFDWWESRVGYAAAIERFRLEGTQTTDSAQDFQKDWVRFWSGSHVTAPVTGPNGVQFKTLLTSLDAVAPPLLELMPTCLAARAAANGGPIGARTDRVGPTGTSSFVAPKTPTGSKSTPAGTPPRVDF